MDAEEEMLSTPSISKSTAAISCVAMTLAYVAILHSPTLIFRFPAPTSFNQFMIRRFICAIAASLLCLFVSSLLLLPQQSWKTAYLFTLYGIQADHVWHAVVFPFTLTSLVYAGSLVYKCVLLSSSWNGDESEGIPLNCLHIVLHKIYSVVISVASNIAAWRNLVVAPITEELVFRACMIPLLLCGGFKAQTVVLLCPVFFSLAHLNHLLEFYYQRNYSLQRTFMAVGTQLAYTMIFGSYASFLFIRTGMSCLLVFRWDFVSFFQPCLFSCLRSRKVAFSAKLLVLHLFVLELLFMNFEFTTKVVLSTTASDEFTGNIRGITQPYP
ncbi:hypothetical protein BVRB_7g159670 isoform B [Beta vulgaris subsp. vulgaris]|nr:hypothetical protein BVRB_7g159670 isoform B [Beta vulgaris subsp. vulgaris]